LLTCCLAFFFLPLRAPGSARRRTLISRPPQNQRTRIPRRKTGLGGKLPGARKGKKKNAKQQVNKAKPGRVTSPLPNLKQMKELQQQLQAGKGLDDLLSPGLPHQRKDQPWP